METILLIKDKHDTNFFHVYSNIEAMYFAFSLHGEDVRDIFGPDVLAECKHIGTAKVEIKTRIVQ